MSFLKTRAISSGGRSFSEQAKRAQKAATRGAGFKNIPGQFNSFWPRADKALWFAICPNQAWTSQMYSREAQGVVTFENDFFFAYTAHRAGKKGRTFYCSAGAHGDQPCWGHGIRNHFYDRKRQIEEETGIKPQGEAPVSSMQQFALAGVLLESIGKVPVLDDHGNKRSTRDGKPILRDVPLALLPPAEAKKLRDAGATTFGMSVHYSVGITHLNSLTAFDEELMNWCASCGNQLYAVTLACMGCGQEIAAREDGEPIAGQDLVEARGADFECECGYIGKFVPMVLCNCENAREGSLLDFALRLKTEKVGDKQNVLKFTEVKPISYFTQKYPIVQQLLNEPLNLPEIFAPTPLETQVRWIPEEYRGDGVSPMPRRAAANAEPPATAYPLSGEEGDE